MYLHQSIYKSKIVKSTIMVPAQEWNGACRYIFRYTRLLVFLLMYCHDEASAQTRIPCNEITGDMGFTVESVRIRARWIPQRLQSSVEQLVGLGQAFDPPRLSSAIELIRDELTKAETAFGIRLTGSTSVLYIDADVCDVSEAETPRLAQVTIRAYYLRIDLFNIGKNILPVPRSSKPTFFSEIPSAMLWTSPFIGFSNDRQYGPSVSIQTTTDVLQFNNQKNRHPSKTRLNIDLDARKSLSNPFHAVGVNLSLLHPVYTDTAIGWNVAVGYAQRREPLGKGRYSRDLFRVSGTIQGSLKTSLVKKYALGAGTRFLNNEYSSGANTEVRNPENGYELFTVADGRLGKGFSRLGIWFDAGIPRKNIELRSYQRIAARVGYGTTLGSGHHNVGFEATAGSGYSWGTPPAYNQFFSGNTASNFLYEPLSSTHHRVHPDGPIVRSLGEREGGFNSLVGSTTGGASYWHVNLNVSIPISRWARPLIPDIVISEEPRVMTLRSALKGQVATAKNFILDDLINNHGLPDTEETEAVADRIVNQDIRPTLDYLADRANVYSVKPLLLFDLAQMWNQVKTNKLWLAAGLGVQATIVVARLELGYMHTLAPASDKGTGNLFIRFVLQNFY
jgi:hypothetical protein